MTTETFSFDPMGPQKTLAEAIMLPMPAIAVNEQSVYMGYGLARTSYSYSYIPNYEYLFFSRKKKLWRLPTYSTLPT